MPADVAATAPSAEARPGQEPVRGRVLDRPGISRPWIARLLIVLPWAAAGAWLGWSMLDRFHAMPWGMEWEDAYVYQWAADGFVSDPSRLYVDAHIQQLTSIRAHAAFIYPPTGLLPFLPLVGISTSMGVSRAAMIWTGVDMAALVAGLTIAGRRFGLSWRQLGVAMLLFSFTAPVLVELQSGQVNGLEILLLVLAWERLPRASGGVLLGLALALKPIAALLCLGLVVKRRWRALGTAAATLVLLTLPFAVLVGVSGIRYFVTDVGPFMLRQDTWDPANLSLTALADTFIAGRGMSDNDPRTLVPFAHAALALSLLVAIRLALAGGVLVTMMRTRLEGHVEVAVLMATIPLTAATVWSHYYVYALPLVLLVMASSRRRLRLTAWILVLPVLWSGMHVQWVGDPFWYADVMSRALYAKSQLFPLVTLALLTAVLRLLSPNTGHSSVASPSPQATRTACLMVSES